MSIAMSIGTPRAPVIAVINSNDDLVGALRDQLQNDGYAVVSMHIRDIKSGEENLTAFLERHDPDLIVYDIALPCDANWTFFQMIRALPQVGSRPFVSTTVNKRALDKKVGVIDAIEIIGGHADDLAATLDMIRKVLKTTVPAESRLRGGPKMTTPNHVHGHRRPSAGYRDRQDSGNVLSKCACECQAERTEYNRGSYGLMECHR